MTPKKKKRKKETSLIARIWAYFLIFTIIVLIVIWLIQNILIHFFYENRIVRQVQNFGNEVMTAYSQDEEYIPKIKEESLESCYKSYILDENGSVLYPINWISEYYLGNFRERDLQWVIDELPESQGESKLLEIDDEYFYYIGNLGNNDQGQEEFLLIEASSKPLDSTMAIMDGQFPYIAVATIIISVIISYFVSKRISRPIENINEAAKYLGSANYDIEFPKSDIEEINELSYNLNYAREKLSNIDESRVSILTNISHDLKTPITVIKSYAEMIRDITGDDKEARQEDLEIIIAESNRVTEMINSILDFTKLEQDMDELRIEEFSLRELTHQLVKNLKSLLEKENYQIEITGNSPGIIRGDRSKIYQVAYNLITNGLNHVGEDKKVIIDISENRKEIVYSVIDHGPGVKKELQGKIWEKYYTCTSDNYCRKTVGTGLGLHIAKVICDQHGFQYGVESEEGEGSRFYFKTKKP